MKLSKRMEAAAAMVSAGNILADVGTDHGYIPIELVQRGIIPSAIAMDLREGPLSRAREHIKERGLSERIELRLSDGVAALAEGEADTILIAGMGGELVIHILSDGAAVCRSARELILQPQSQIAEVRSFLRENGYRIAAEDMVLEDGKFYPMMRVTPEQETGTRTASERQYDSFRKEVTDLYGPMLLQQKHPVLAAFLEREYSQQTAILTGLQKQPQSGKILLRTEEVSRRLAYNKEAQEYINGGCTNAGI
jgi:tRNA (adenine22-N1)-methyltransferase